MRPKDQVLSEPTSGCPNTADGRRGALRIHRGHRHRDVAPPSRSTLSAPTTSCGPRSPICPRTAWFWSRSSHDVSRPRAGVSAYSASKDEAFDEILPLVAQSLHDVATCWSTWSFRRMRSAIVVPEACQLSPRQNRARRQAEAMCFSVPAAERHRWMVATDHGSDDQADHRGRCGVDQPAGTRRRLAASERPPPSGAPGRTARASRGRRFRRQDVTAHRRRDRLVGASAASSSGVPATVRADRVPRIVMALVKLVPMSSIFTCRRQP